MSMHTTQLCGPSQRSYSQPVQAERAAGNRNGGQRVHAKPVCTQRQLLIDAGVIRPGRGATLPRVSAPIAVQLDKAGDEAAALEIWCTNRREALEIMAGQESRVRPGLRLALQRLAALAAAGLVIEWNPLDPWLWEMAGNQPDA